MAYGDFAAGRGVKRVTVLSDARWAFSYRPGNRRKSGCLLTASPSGGFVFINLTTPINQERLYAGSLAAWDNPLLPHQWQDRIVIAGPAGVHDTEAASTKY